MMDNDTRLLVIDGLKARIRACQESTIAMEQMIKELTADGKAARKGTVIPGRWEGTRAAKSVKTKADKPKRRKMSPAARKRISEGIRNHHAKKRAEGRSDEHLRVDVEISEPARPENVEIDIPGPDTREMAFAHDPRD